tara:strand:- start:132 stop:980 length:849 start_codon:yes stop_codon:yes gene_type:complete
MNNINKILIVTLAVFLTGCGLTVPGFDNSNTSDPNSSEYKVVLDKYYDGYGDDDDLTSAEIDKGAANFAQCANATECSLLWDTAIEWLTTKSNYKGTLETNTKNLLETKADPRKKKADKITFKVIRIPNGKTNIIQISAKCPRNCKNFIDKEYFAFNSYLNTHLVAYKKGIIGYAQVENEVLENTESSGELDIDISDLTGNSEVSILEENEKLDKIDITKMKKKRYISEVAERLIDDYSCNKQSEINLVKKTRKRELYEVNCIKEVKRLIFDCTPDGCEVLQ